jgi:hypothetical protein
LHAPRAPAVNTANRAAATRKDLFMLSFIPRPADYHRVMRHT